MANKTGKGSPTYGSGRIVKPNGYVYLWKPGHPMAHKDGYVAEHRYVVFEAGAKLTRNDHVHHVNGDKQDNRLENLEVLSPSDHHRGHIGPTVVNQFGTWPARVPLSEREHGRVATYTGHGCRCRPCTLAASAHTRKYRNR